MKKKNLLPSPGIKPNSSINQPIAQLLDWLSSELNYAIWYVNINIIQTHKVREWGRFEINQYFLFPWRRENQENNIILTVCDKTALTAWQVAMHLASAH
jgi:hypothetical protein